MTVTAYSPLAGVTLMNTRLRQDYGVNLVSIERAGKIFDLPDKDMIIMPTDRLTVLGNEEQLAKVRAVVEVEPDMLIHDHTDNEINTYRLEISDGNHLIGTSIKNSNFMSAYQSMVIAIERGKEYMLNPSADTLFQHGDVVWFVSPLDLKIKEMRREDKDYNV